jgi:hypothetical protein
VGLIFSSVFETDPLCIVDRRYVQSTAHQTTHFRLCTALKGLSTNIDLQLYSVTCCWPYLISLHFQSNVEDMSFVRGRDPKQATYTTLLPQGKIVRNLSFRASYVDINLHWYLKLANSEYRHHATRWLKRRLPRDLCRLENFKRAAFAMYRQQHIGLYIFRICIALITRALALISKCKCIAGCAVDRTSGCTKQSIFCSWFSILTSHILLTTQHDK